MTYREMAAEDEAAPELTPAGRPKGQVPQDIDGNIFAIAGAAGRALSHTGHTRAEIDGLYRAIMATTSYAQALQTVMAWVEFV